MASLPEKFLTEANSAFSPAWKMADLMRQAKGDKLPDWPDEVFLPFVAWVQGLMGPDVELTADDIFKLQRIACAAAWRPGQDIVRFDPAVYAAIADTPLTGAIPSEVLWRLPAWCVYVETPGLTLFDASQDGFFARLDVRGEDRLMRLMFLSEAGSVEMLLELGDWPLKEAFERPLENVVKARGLNGIPPDIYDSHALQTAVNLLLYICAYGLTEKREHTVKPAYPKPKKVKSGWRLFPPAKPKIHELGVELASQLRAASSSPHPHGSPSPHIRRAHWHGFWTGQKGRQTLEVRWLPPMAVALKDE